MTTVSGAVVVWTAANGTPERLVWNGNRYRITDTPTPLDIDYAAITHPASLPFGWRFQGTSDCGDSRVFDVLFDETRQEWHVLHTYE